jgi:NAD(P)-dependent dehydrogenase (short-subunit alcohol dehydrogenase family)
MVTIDLSGKVALVIGGSRGIGEGITRVLCDAGAYTVFTWTGNPAHAGRAAELAASLGSGKAEAAAVDACDPKATQALVDRIIGARGRIDILVCNAGKNTQRQAYELSDEQWTESLSLNLDSAFYAVRAVLPSMLAAGNGKIVFIGSSAVWDGGGGAIDYAAAKAGLSGMLTYLCRTYARKGIMTNIVHPAVIETDLLKQRYPDEESKRKLAAQIPAGRLGQPRDIAGMVAYLASDWGDYICGQEILLDGGRTLFRGM